jgi:hypothetical protein
MGILDDINNMKGQGMPDREISMRLQERGASPRVIEDAFNQIRIKRAVSAESSGEEGMEPSIMNENPKQNPSLYVPKTQEINHGTEELYAPPPIQAPQYNAEIEAPQYGSGGGEYAQEEYYPQEGYEEQGGGGAYDTDTLIEIAEQVFSEKIKKEQKQIESLNEFATLAETRLSDDHERIKRMEGVIDKLQAAILEKVGSYGRNLESIKNEMGMMQESFEKMVGGKAYKNEESEEETHIHHQRKNTSKSRK